MIEITVSYKIEKNKYNSSTLC